MTSRKLLRTIIVCLSASALFGCNRHHDQDASKSQTESTSPEVPKVVLEAKPPPDAVSLPSAADLAPAIPPQEQTGAVAPPAPQQVDPVITDAETRASAIDAKLAEMSKHQGEWALGEAHSTYSAYSQDKDPSLIDEQLDMADAGSSSNKYYFNNGNLYLYEEDGHWRETNPPDPIATRHIQRTMVFDASGKLVTASKLIDGVAAPVQGYEANAVLAQALNLRNATMAAPPPPKTSTVAPEKPVKPAEKTAAPGEEPRKPVKKTETAGGNEANATGDNHLRLEAGKGPTVVKGTVATKQVREYFVQAKSGQLMTVNLQSPNQAATFAVYSSHGEIVSGLTDWSAKLPRDGDYRIRIVSSRSGGPIEYSMRVTLQ